MKKTIIRLSVLLLAAGLAQAAWIPVGSYCFDIAGACLPGTGAPVDIPDEGSPLSGTITGSGLPSSILGRDLRIRLYGLTHSWSGDLVIEIKRVLGGILDRTETVFDRIGVVNTGDLGFSSNFDTAGTAFDGDGIGYYEFQALGARDLWLTAQPPFASDTDPISTRLSFVPSLAGGAPILWSQFDGVDPNGAWELTIRDLASGETGWIQGWDLAIFQNDVPEPATFGLTLGAAAALWIGRRHRRTL